MPEGSSEGGSKGLWAVVKKGLKSWADNQGFTKESRIKDAELNERLTRNTEAMEAVGSKKRLVIPKDPDATPLDIRLDDAPKERKTKIISTTPPTRLERKRAERDIAEGKPVDPLIKSNVEAQKPTTPGSGLDNKVLNMQRPKEKVTFTDDPTPPNPDRPTPPSNPRTPRGPKAA